MIEFKEIPEKRKAAVDRSWRRWFVVEGAEPMRRQRSVKREDFFPEKVKIEVARRDFLHPRLTQAVVHGWWADDTSSLVSFNRETMYAAPDWLVEKVDEVIEEVIGAWQKTIVNAIRTAAEDAANESYMETKANSDAGELWVPESHVWARSSWQGAVKELIDAGILGPDALEE